MPTPHQAAYAQVQLDIQAELESIALQYQIRPGDLESNGTAGQWRWQPLPCAGDLPTWPTP